MERTADTVTKSNDEGNTSHGNIHVPLLFAYLLSSGLIISAALGDLWLDEIWSINFARDANTAGDIFFRFHHDNNHPLNTLFLYYRQEQSVFIVYRLLAVLSGIGSVFLLSHVARRDWGYPEALCCVVLSGTSFPLLLYFSEARGYAPAIFFAVLSYSVLRQNLIALKLHRLLLFWVASVLGILSHSTFAIACVALFIMNLAHAIHANGSIRRRLLEFLAHQAPPFAFLASWYLFFVRDMIIGGGPVYGTFDVIREAASLLLGFPGAPPFQLLALIAMLAIIVGGSFCLSRDKNIQWVFFPSVLLLSPALLLVFTQPNFLYFRYFIICFPFFYLLLSYTVCRCYRTWSKPYRLLLVLAIMLLIVGQAIRTYPLLTIGRGSYSLALAHIMKNSPRPTILVGSDHDFRNRVLLDFYAPFMLKDKDLRYIHQSRWHEEPPDWFFTHSQELLYQPPTRYLLKEVGFYRLVDEYRFSGISGWNWFLYRREEWNERARINTEQGATADG